MLQSKLEQQFTKQKTRGKVRCKCRWIWNHKKFTQYFCENFCHNFKKTALIWIKVGTHNLHTSAQAWHPRSSSSDNIRQDMVVDTARDLRLVIDSGLSISDHIHCRLLLSLLSAVSVTWSHIHCQKMLLRRWSRCLFRANWTTAMHYCVASVKNSVPAVGTKCSSADGHRNPSTKPHHTGIWDSFTGWLWGNESSSKLWYWCTSLFMVSPYHTCSMHASRCWIA